MKMKFLSTILVGVFLSTVPLSASLPLPQDPPPQCTVVDDGHHHPYVCYINWELKSCSCYRTDWWVEN